MPQTPTWWNFDGLILQAIHQGTRIDFDALGASRESDEFHNALERLGEAGFITGLGPKNGSGHYQSWGPPMTRATGSGMRMLQAWPVDGIGAEQLASAVAADTAAVAELDPTRRREAMSVLSDVDGVVGLGAGLMALAKLLVSAEPG